MHLVMAQVLATRGVDGFVFRGDDGLDEITLSSTTSILSIGNGEIRSDLIEPSDFGISRAPVSELVGGDAAENARITLAIFAGEKGAPRDAVLLNAAAAIAAFEGEQDLALHDRLARGLRKAETAVDSGATTDLLQKCPCFEHLIYFGDTESAHTFDDSMENINCCKCIIKSSMVWCNLGAKVDRKGSQLIVRNIIFC
jgi:anthranilate phosphoribosyltransferase